ncbi:hypothetical protein RND81_10G148300 [Saponaria officinalis]|uniref:Uncharacterized protein n=1 Tax=Saponaria officinalis TaxID=3572 RepID=A0AAW1I3E5_SAPOF
MIEVDVAQPLPEHVFLNTPFSDGFAQKIVYEWVPFYYFECDKLGHLVDTCWLRKKKLGVKPSVVPPQIETHLLEVVTDSGSQVLGGISDSGVKDSMLMNGEKGSGCAQQGPTIPAQVLEDSSLDAVTHSECPVLGHTSAFNEDSSNLIVRECNTPLKLKEVSDLLRGKHVDVMGILETRIREANSGWLIRNYFGGLAMFCCYNEQKKGSSTIREWIILGGFNVIIDVSERISSILHNLDDILAFNSCFLHYGLMDLQSSGCEYTWTNKQDGADRVWSKLDRAMASGSSLTKFPSTSVHFLPAGVSDHSPTLVTILAEDIRPHRFSFLNC